MILADDNTIKDQVSKGLWGSGSQDFSLAGLLAKCANEHPDHVAVCDDFRSEKWSQHQPRQLTWRALNQEVETLALFFRGLGLPEDAVIATYGANTVDFYATILAIHRAGFVAAPLPLYWREHELSAYCRETEISMLIAADRVEDDEPALRIRDLSQDLLDVKYVFGFGSNLPDGVLNVGEILKSIGGMVEAADPLPLPDPNAVVSIHPADLDWNKTETVLPRSSNQWLALEQACFADQDTKPITTLNPYALSGLTGFLISIVQGLKSGNKTQLHHYHNEHSLKYALNQCDATRIVVPGALTDAMAALDSTDEKQVCLVWKNHEAATKQASSLPNCRSIVDLTVLNNVGAITQTRNAGDLSCAPLPLDADNNAVSLSIKGATGKVQAVKTGGELVMTGAAIPTDLYPTNNEHRALRRLRNKNKDNFASTHLACRFADENKETVEPIGFLPDCIFHSGQCVLREDLEKTFRSIEGIEDLALYHDTMNDTLNLAIVLERGRAMTVATFEHHLKQKNLSLTKYPDIIIEVDKIETGPTGMADTKALQGIFEEDAVHIYELEKKINLLKSA
ncbi:MAG: AMP-binding protein [Hyphomicrobiales bacterium]